MADVNSPAEPIAGAGSNGDSGCAPWHRPVFVYAPGRSGSTLVARLLNCMSGLTLWGEHAGIVRQLVSVHAELSRPKFLALVEEQRAGAEALALKQAVPRVAGSEMTIEWANLFGVDDVVTALRRFVLDLFTDGLPEDRRWGFKEIRYGEQVYEFMRMLFPASQSVLLTRDPSRVLRSQFVHFLDSDPSRLPDALNDLSAFQDFVRKVLNEDAGPTTLLHLDYSRVVSDSRPVMSELEAFLAETADAAALGAIEITPPSDRKPEPFDEGGPEATAEALTRLFSSNGARPPVGGIEHCVHVYQELRSGTQAGARAGAQRDRQDPGHRPPVESLPHDRVAAALAQAYDGHVSAQQTLGKHIHR